MADAQQGLIYQPYRKRAIPFTGKWLPAFDGIVVGTNFTQFTNCRYSDAGPRGIGGMTKINSSVMNATYLKARSAHHFRKAQPAESHILVQAYNAALSASQVLQNKADVPGTGEFEAAALWTDSGGAGRGHFSNAPDEAVAYCNGVDTLIWGGDESKCKGFINFDPNGAFTKDYTDQVTNTLTDEANRATLSGIANGLDASVKLLLPLDNGVTDSSATGRTVMNIGATFDGSDYIFGGYSAVFNGNAYLEIADSADFNFSGGAFTIDCRIKLSSLAADSPIYYQATDASNYFSISVTTAGAVELTIVASGSAVLTMSTPDGTISAGTWYHLEVTESGDSWYIFTGETAATASIKAAATSSGRAANYTGEVLIGHDSTNYFVGKMDEFRVSATARHTTPFSVPTTAYDTTAYTAYVDILATRPLQGIKFYVGTANTSSFLHP